MQTFISYSEEDTENIGKKLGSKLVKGNEIIYFYGGMGLGKTVFTRGILNYFGKGEEVSSPTFSIVNEYVTPKFKIYHFDMYRINSEIDLESTGFFDYIDNGILIVEWSENILEYFSNEVIKIKISKNKNDTERNIIIEGVEIV